MQIDVALIPQNELIEKIKVSALLTETSKGRALTKRERYQISLGNRALQNLIERYRPWISSQIRQYSRLGVDEVRQACERSIAVAAATYRPGQGGFSTWLRWKFQNELQPLKRQHSRGIRNNQKLRHEAEEHNLYYLHTVDQDLCDRVDALLSGISASSRSILELRFFDDLTYSQIGEHLQISADQVRWLYKKAVREVKDSEKTPQKCANTPKSTERPFQVESVFFVKQLELFA